MHLSLLEEAIVKLYRQAHTILTKWLSFVLEELLGESC